MSWDLVGFGGVILGVRGVCGLGGVVGDCGWIVFMFCVGFLVLFGLLLDGLMGWFVDEVCECVGGVGGGLGFFFCCCFGMWSFCWWGCWFVGEIIVCDSGGLVLICFFGLECDCDCWICKFVIFIMVFLCGCGRILCFLNMCGWFLRWFVFKLKVWLIWDKFIMGSVGFWLFIVIGEERWFVWWWFGGVNELLEERVKGERLVLCLMICLCCCWKCVVVVVSDFIVGKRMCYVGFFLVKLLGEVL